MPAMTPVVRMTRAKWGVTQSDEVNDPGQLDDEGGSIVSVLDRSNRTKHVQRPSEGVDAVGRLRGVGLQARDDVRQGRVALWPCWFWQVETSIALEVHFRENVARLLRWLGDATGCDLVEGATLPSLEN